MMRLSMRYLQCAATGLSAALVAVLFTACSMGMMKPESVIMDNLVLVSSGELLGNAADASGIFSFKGIPYAAAPVGKLRWKAPQPAPAWSGVRDATKFGAKCWAAAPFGGPIDTHGVSEDCLFLNVWTSAPNRSEKLPVMVWIHGGGFQFGTASSDTLDGASLAKKGVVVVTLNYRLGVFGFLTRPDLELESNGHKSGMYGLQDQLAALRWVKENIGAFGGDPGNVTVFGESAGAHAVGLLMSSPLADGLFQKAIGESGAFWESEHGTMKPYHDAQAMGIALGAKVAATTLDKLRDVSAENLQMATNWTFATDPGATNFSPTVDGYVLPESPYERFLGGRQNDVPLLAGWNADEGALFFNRALPHKTVQAFTEAAATQFGAANVTRFLQLYPAGSAEQAAHSAQMLIGDQVIKLQMWRWLTAQRETGHSPVYAYQFEQVSQFNRVATHTTEIPYVFGNFPANAPARPDAHDLVVSDTMQSYWTNFARTSNPTCRYGLNTPAQVAKSCISAI